MNIDTMVHFIYVEALKNCKGELEKLTVSVRRGITFPVIEMFYMGEIYVFDDEKSVAALISSGMMPDRIRSAMQKMVGKKLSSPNREALYRFHDVQREKIALLGGIVLASQGEDALKEIREVAIHLVPKAENPEGPIFHAVCLKTLKDALVDALSVRKVTKETPKEPAPKKRKPGRPPKLKKETIDAF